ncbi:MAG: hypothetical protein A2086_15425 [Spirochaetes bacterium GWD1_27_9]|nr:MAG: hypothetical protein A2Z98_17895 [Spirochaetes bacterium GWB1_27_13]OHD21595.1 MAG: hypothetical protein A2Y34_13940 [Spirochaetes bacterium GWC1_27_15]OHD42773.1 MAG: hypothetical protein A2086_15425 [Spirochaetes bacterium GWD1_27_9]
MKISVIIGSPRKGFTYKILQLFEKKINSIQECEFKYIFLNQYDLKYCIGCGKCIDDEMACPLKDDYVKLKDEMMNSDIVFFCSPVYENHETALIKNFFDRFRCFLFRPIFANRNKYAVLLSVASRTGLFEVLRFLNFVVKGWGFNVENKIGILSTEFENDKLESIEKYLKGDVDKTKLNANKYTLDIVNKIEYISRNIVDSYNRKQPYRPNFDDLVLFKDLKERIIAVKNKYTKAYSFWQDNDLLNRYYFSKVKLNPISKLFLKLSKFKFSKN